MTGFRVKGVNRVLTPCGCRPHGDITQPLAYLNTCFHDRKGSSLGMFFVCEILNSKESKG